MSTEYIINISDMYYVYILRSLNDGRSLYVGITSNVERRLQAHNEGLSIYTRTMRPWEIIYYEAFKSKRDAQERESQLKHFGRAWAHLKKRLSESLSRSSKGAGL